MKESLLKKFKRIASLTTKKRQKLRKAGQFIYQENIQIIRENSWSEEVISGCPYDTSISEEQDAIYSQFKIWLENWIDKTIDPILDGKNSLENWENTLRKEIKRWPVKEVTNNSLRYSFAYNAGGPDYDIYNARHSTEVKNVPIPPLPQ